MTDKKTYHILWKGKELNTLTKDELIKAIIELDTLRRKANQLLESIEL